MAISGKIITIAKPKIIINTNTAGIVGAIIAALIVYIQYKKLDVTMILNGALGGLVAITAGADVVGLWEPIIIGAVGLVVLVLFPRDSKALNALLLGESEARHLGIDVQKVKRRLIILTTLGVGVSVAIAGMIGFVGLVVPHIVRLLIGPDHRSLLPVSALAGGILLVIADTVARVIISPTELPTGILTALLGAPLFILLLTHQRKASTIWP